MANEVTNILEFDCSEERFKEILDFIKVDGSYPGSVDFGKLVPLPELLMQPSDAEERQGYEIYKKYLGNTWDEPDDYFKEAYRYELLKEENVDPEVFEIGKRFYEKLVKLEPFLKDRWCAENWGTKANAFDCDEVSPDDMYLSFRTNWSEVHGLVQKLSERFPDVCICYKWADEEIGHNVGRCYYENGEVFDDYEPCSGTKEAYLLSAEMHGLGTDELNEILEIEGFPVHDRDDDAR